MAHPVLQFIDLSSGLLECGPGESFQLSAKGRVQLREMVEVNLESPRLPQLVLEILQLARLLEVEHQSLGAAAELIALGRSAHSALRRLGTAQADAAAFQASQEAARVLGGSDLPSTKAEPVEPKRGQVAAGPFARFTIGAAYEER